MKRSKDIPAKVRGQVAQRSAGFCEAWIEGVCPPHYHRASQMHHRRTRAQRGEHTPENLLHVCNAAHNWIHAHPAKSYENGWLIQSRAS